ncbi:hypothetical protein [Thalassomonas actiniarum]|nr:hypothetical protein [Thalassomonas actiniarum]
MDEVRSLWGQPESIRYFTALKDRPEDRSVIWEYTNGMEIDFSSEDNFLASCITSHSDKAELNNNCIVGKTIAELKAVYPNIVLDDDFEENGQDYVLQEFELSFWVSDGFVVNVTVFPEYDESGNNIIWPGEGC